MRAFLLVWLIAASAFAADWKPLFNGKNLDGWEIIGDGQWTVSHDGTLIGQREADPRKLMIPGGQFTTASQFNNWLNVQSWLYTKRGDFDEFDLRLEYWTKTHGNSGVSLRDVTRAAAAITIPPDYRKTPSKTGYEIQINNRYPDPHPSGSIYGLQDAPSGAQRDDDWNAMEIVSRRDKITVKLNGQVVAEHVGDPQRPKTGPIGLQLHDQFSIVMFRRVEIREISKQPPQLQ